MKTLKTICFSGAAVALVVACSPEAHDVAEGPSGSAESSGGEAGTTTSGSGSGASSSDTGVSTTSGATEEEGTSSSGTVGASEESSGDEGSSGGGFEMPSTCDYETRDGIVVIEAEALDFESPWETDVVIAGATGDGALVWTGESLLQDATRSPIQVSIGFAEAGQYHFDWRSAFEGKSFTRNSTWVRFDAGLGLYAMDTAFDNNVRLYARPTCYDLDVLAEVAGLPGVDSVQCVGGWSHQRWLDPFNRDAGDLSWSWTASVLSNFSLSNELAIDIPEPGNYVLTLAPRLQGHTIDRIVLYAEGIDPDVARDLDLQPTECTP
ncbi:MAG: hypothetical protein ACRBN8_02090 [Nannocystales bacterium]